MVRTFKFKFSLLLLLIIMTCLSLLVSAEVQRANAIKATTEQIIQWKGETTYKDRPSLPALLVTFLPQEYVADIDTVYVGLYSANLPEPSLKIGNGYVIAEPGDLTKIVRLGALNQVKKAALRGTLIDRTTVEEFCRSTKVGRCLLLDSVLTAEEVDELKSMFPACDFEVEFYRRNPFYFSVPVEKPS